MKPATRKTEPASSTHPPEVDFGGFYLFLIAKNTIHLGRLVIGLTLAGWFCAAAAAVKPPPDKLDLNFIHPGSIAVDQAVLGLSHPSESARAFFSVARQAFEQQPKARFTDLPVIGAAAAQQGLLLLGGPMLGDLSPDGAKVWVRTVRPAQVTVLASVDGKDRRFGPVASTAQSDLVAVVTVNGLAPGSRYPYRVLVDDQPVTMPDGAAITTPSAPDQPGRMTFAFGADFHKSGMQDQALLERIGRSGSSALVLIGDLAVDDRYNLVGLHRSDYLLRDLSVNWRNLVAGVAVYAGWDDHDYFSNDLAGIPPKFSEADRAAVRAVWAECWNNPAGGAKDGAGIYFHTRVGLFDLIMLDTRSCRTAPGEPDCFLGPEQMRWLERELTRCTAPFILLTSGTMWSDNISAGKDSWGKWDPKGRERILNFIEERRIPGVILLSGDRHGARVMTIPRPSGYTFYEFELGSLGGHQGPAPFGTSPQLQLFGRTDTVLYGECALDSTVADPTATIRIVDTAGSEQFRVALTRSQLTPPPANAR